MAVVHVFILGGDKYQKGSSFLPSLYHSGSGSFISNEDINPHKLVSNTFIISSCETAGHRVQTQQELGSRDGSAFVNTFIVPRR